MNINDILRAIGAFPSEESVQQDDSREHDHSVPHFLMVLRKGIEELNESIEYGNKKVECATQERDTLIRVVEMVESALSKGE